MARQIERPDVLYEAVKDLADCGYNVCMLYLEDAYKYPRHPLISRKNAYPVESMQYLQSLCKANKMELVPVIPALGHCGYITNKKGYDHYDEGRGTKERFGSISPSFPETYDLLRELFEDWCLHIPGKYLHAGLDESASMGQYFIRTRPGEKLDAARMFADHCNRLAQIAHRLKRKLIIWGDMLYYLPQAIPFINKDIIINDWYYYTFPKTPRVEVFNFEAIDSAGIFKRAGFEVWGIPSIWPNFPLPDIKDRWQNLKDWIKYGRKVGIDGILICDWENSTGFFSVSDLLYRSFATHIKKPNNTSLIKTVSQTVDRILGQSCNHKIIQDMMAFGPFHLTGHCRRRYLSRPLVAMSCLMQQKETKSYATKLEHMFIELPEMLKKTKSGHGYHLLESFHVSWDFLRLYWKLCTMIPDWRRQLLQKISVIEKRELYNKFLNVADELDNLAASYNLCWEKVRYADDTKVIEQWALKTAITLREWTEAIQTGCILKHPLVNTPLLEIKLRCRHPALPCVRIKIEWEKEEFQIESETLIRFESKYATPNIKWNETSCIALTRKAWPTRIELEQLLYGELGIDEVAVIWGKDKRVYHLSSKEGKCIVLNNKTLWLGPRRGYLDSPLQLTDTNKVSFSNLRNFVKF